MFGFFGCSFFQCVLLFLISSELFAAQNAKITLQTQHTLFDDHISISVFIHNDGDISIEELELEILKGEDILYKGHFGRIAPGSETFIKQLNLPKEKIETTRFLLGYLKYTTLDKVPYSSPFVIQIYSEKDTSCIKTNVRNLYITDLAKLELNIMNQCLSPKEYRISPFLPEEIKSEKVETTKRLVPGDEELITFKILNRWATPGSVYPGFVLIRDLSGEVVEAAPFDIIILKHSKWDLGALNLVFSIFLLLGALELARHMDPKR
jgi:hypothetical protein